MLEETIQVVLLEGEEENDYLTKAEERMDAANKNFKVQVAWSAVNLITEYCANWLFFSHLTSIVDRADEEEAVEGAEEAAVVDEDVEEIEAKETARNNFLGSREIIRDKWQHTWNSISFIKIPFSFFCWIDS